MKDFFKSTHFKILAFILALVFTFMLRAAYSGTAETMLAQAAMWVLTPIQRTSAAVTYSVRDTVSNLLSGPRLALEKEELESEVAALRSQLVEYDRLKTENEQLKNYLEIKEKNPDFDFEPAMVIGRDPAERFFSFTIDKGKNSGISVNDPVITEQGLVGIVSEVGYTYSKVLTVLDVAVEVGVIDSVTREIGVSEGELMLAQQGLFRVSYLSRTSQAQAGDLIATTGIGGIYPRELVVGTIKEILPDSKGLSSYAVVEPPADIRAVENVIVIKHFEGQASEENGE